MVPTSSMIMMAVNAVLGLAVPVCLSIYLVRRHHAKLTTILIGAGTFFLFALVLESIMHQLVLKGPHGAAITGNPLWYAIYGGLAAGIFEETGRFSAALHTERTGAISAGRYWVFCSVFRQMLPALLFPHSRETLCSLLTGSTLSFFLCSLSRSLFSPVRRN